MRMRRRLGPKAARSLMAQQAFARMLPAAIHARVGAKPRRVRHLRDVAVSVRRAPCAISLQTMTIPAHQERVHISRTRSWQRRFARRRSVTRRFEASTSRADPVRTKRTRSRRTVSFQAKLRYEPVGVMPLGLPVAALRTERLANSDGFRRRSGLRGACSNFSNTP